MRSKLEATPDQYGAIMLFQTILSFLGVLSFISYEWGILFKLRVCSVKNGLMDSMLELWLTRAVTGTCCCAQRPQHHSLSCMHEVWDAATVPEGIA